METEHNVSSLAVSDIDEQFSQWLARSRGEGARQEVPPDGLIGWYDYTMNADKHFKLSDVLPVDAAMLLCQYDPLQENIEYAVTCTNDATGPVDMKALRAHFEALSRTDQKHRTLLDWWQLARGAKLKYHPWIDQYIDAAGLEAQAAQGAPYRWTPHVVATQTQPKQASSNEWVSEAQNRAHEIIKEQRARDLYPGQLGIADQIAREFRAAGKFGADGKPISGAYIKRHALKGITSAIGKQLSTSKRQSK